MLSQAHTDRHATTDNPVTESSAPVSEVIPFDENEFRKDLTALIPHLRAFARSLCGNAALADDIAQDAMLKAWKSRERFKPGTNLKAPRQKNFREHHGNWRF